MFFPRATLLRLVAASSLLFVSTTRAQEENDTLYLTGFLADMLCTRLEIAPDAANMLLNPAEHTVRCELLPACQRSGYGLIQNIGTDGNPLYRVAAVFDEAANDYVVDMFQSMDTATADLRVHVRGNVVLASTPSSQTPAITGSSGQVWPAMNDVPTITIEALQFCNYQGPDAQRLVQEDVCTSTTSLLEGLADATGETMAAANLCMDSDISLTSASSTDYGEYYLLTPTGCADHATFQDVKRATVEACQAAADPCPDGGDGSCTTVDTCTAQCLDACGNPLVLANGKVAPTCCLDACGNPYVDACGFPLVDACGNPTTDTGAQCTPTNVGQNQVNECLDGCGSPLQDACGNPVEQCCLDGCGNPLVDGCGIPFIDACGNPAGGANGENCTTIGANTCLPRQDCPDNEQCDLECVDACGNPLVLATGVTVTSCCLDGCGNPILNPCGFPYYDACGNPTLADGGVCTNVAENEVNMCVDACGNPLQDACGSPVDDCCLDGCGNPIVDACGFPIVDACGNPLAGINSTTLCAAEQLGTNTCHGACTTECVDACGNPLTDACGNPAASCCIDPCGNPILNPCGFPYVDACGNPTLADGGVCTNVAQNDCDAGSGGGSGWRNLMESWSTTTTSSSSAKRINKAMIAKNRKATQRKTLGRSNKKNNRLLTSHMANEGNAGSSSGTCKNECADACGNPIVKDISGRFATTCCLDGCGNPILDGCGFPFYDACGNPQDGYSRNPCPPENIGESDINECVDACGSPIRDSCGNPVEHCCLDACGNPLLDQCGSPWVDACGNPASDAAGTTCTAQNTGENACPRAFGGGGCAAECVDACGNPLVLSSGRTATACCLDACGNPLVDGCGFPYLDPCGNPTLADGSACPMTNIAENDVNECVDGCGSPLVDACGSPVTQCCLDGCGNPLVDPCGIPWMDACGNPTDATGGVCTNVGANTCSETEDGGVDCTPAFPPASGSFQCEGLISPCTIAMLSPLSSENTSDGIPEGIVVGRRRAAARKKNRRMQGESSVPPYTPLKKDLRFKIPRTPTTMRVRSELDPAHDGIIGVAVNGVPIVHEHPGEGANTLLFDSCGGHGDLANRYHYHLPPVCLLRSLGGTVPRSSDWWLAPNAENQWPSRASARGNMSPLIGWALDGHPIFGPYNPDNGELVVPSAEGAASGSEECAQNTLDECNGMVLENGVYAYFITPTAPFVPPCLMGNVASDAFVDGGLLEEQVATCPFEGTKPLAGTEICDEKTIIFQDDSCPGNADRQDIRRCFDLATSTFVGEPTCDQMKGAIDEATPCFKDAGCCIDLEETLAEWKAQYPALENCDFDAIGCLAFGSDNVVDVTVTFAADIQDMVPDTRSLLRRNMATALEVESTRVLVGRVSGNSTTSTVIFNVAYPSRSEAEAAAATMDTNAIAARLATGTSFSVSSIELMHDLPPTLPSIPDLWSTKQKAGLGLSLTAVVVVMALMVYLEDFAGSRGHGTEHADGEPSGNVQSSKFIDEDKAETNGKQSDEEV